MIAMDGSEIISRLRDNADAIRGLGATSLHLFGSVARGEATAKSDIDLFVDYDPDSRFSLLDLVGIKHLLEDAPAVEVDITTRDGLHPMLREDIERDAVTVF